MRILLLCLALAAAPAVAAPWMTERGAVPPPPGWRVFCATTDDLCRAERRLGAGPVALTPERWDQLLDANRFINSRMTPRDEAQDVWDGDATHGDCEDFALAKRSRLMARGWAASHLLIGVGGGHAVLIAHTDAGDFVLDNQTDEVRRWDQADAAVKARQSASLPAYWVRVE